MHKWKYLAPGGYLQAGGSQTVTQINSSLFETADIPGTAPLIGFPFYVKKLFTHNIVTDGYYVVIAVVTTQEKHAKLRYEITLRNYVTKLRCEIMLRNYYAKQKIIVIMLHYGEFETRR